MANILTGLRILCGVLILIFPAFSKWYYLFYFIGGISDAIDGSVARKLGKASDFGAKFDTIADLLFAVSVLTKLFFFNQYSVIIDYMGRYYHTDKSQQYYSRIHKIR